MRTNISDTEILKYNTPGWGGTERYAVDKQSDTEAMYSFIQDFPGNKKKKRLSQRKHYWNFGLLRQPLFYFK
jgi:hypothetical protein